MRKRYIEREREKENKETNKRMEVSMKMPIQKLGKEVNPDMTK